MTEHHYLTWDDVDNRVAELTTHLRQHATPVRRIFGVPRGGCVPAAMLAERLDARLVDHPDQADTIVDDLVDSGATAARFTGRRFVALYRKPHSPVGHGAALEVDAWLVFPWEQNTADEAGPTDAVVRLLEGIGEDPTREGLIDTPRRVVKALGEMTSGSDDDPQAILERVFTVECDEMIVVRGIDFVSLCEHHLLPFTGTADVAYIPNGRVVGLSKIPRLVDAFARRLQLQEQMTQQIADSLHKHLSPQGVGVVVRATHSCLSCRGARKAGAVMVTSALYGLLKDDARARAEFLDLARSHT